MATPERAVTVTAVLAEENPNVTLVQRNGFTIMGLYTEEELALSVCAETLHPRVVASNCCERSR